MRMSTMQAEKKTTRQNQAAGNNVRLQLPFQRFVDNRKETAAQRKLSELVNNSPQVKQLAASQQVILNTPHLSPSFHPSPETVQHQGGVVQRLKEHAQKFINDHSLAIDATFTSIHAYVNNTDNDKALRRGLMKAWNKAKRSGKKRKRQPKEITGPSDLEISGGLPTSGKRLKRSDSFEITTDMDYGTALDDRRKIRKIAIKTLKGDKEEIPLFESSTDATRMVRSFGHQFSTSGGITPGPQFGLQLGPNFGLFDAPRGNDIVYLPLKETSTKGEFLRKGEIFDWSSHAQEMKKSKLDKEELRKTLEGELAPDSEDVLSTAGAMICDAKTSITGFLEFMTSFSTSTETDPMKLFSSNPSDKPIWAPSVKEGRSLPQKKKQELQNLYKLEINSQALLMTNNCLINAIALGAGKPKATMDQLVSIRIESNSVGEMLVASPVIIDIIRRILHIPNKIIIHYTKAPKEEFAGSGPTIDVYHNGVDHFTHTPPMGIIYPP